MSRRDDLRDYRGDVFYDVWRSGGNPDAVDYDRVHDAFYDGISSGEAADYELRCQRSPREEEESEAYYQELAEAAEWERCEEQPQEQEHEADDHPA